jgi:hypothetical protein
MKRRARKLHEQNKKMQADRAKEANAPAGKSEKKGGFQGGLEEYARKIQEGAWQKDEGKKTNELLAKQNEISGKILQQLQKEKTPSGNQMAFAS